MKPRGIFPPTIDRVREILEATPEVAGRGKHFLERIARLAETLQIWGARTNLTAHPEDVAEVAFHVIDSLAPLFVESTLGIFRAGARVLDLGSGAGFPGLILAAATDADFTLIEARRKRASFLSTAATEMELTNVKVICQRATPANVTMDFDVLTSRAVGATSIEIAANALRPGGIAIFWAGPEQKIDSNACRAACLGQSTRHEYTVQRGSQVTRRSLLTLQKLSS